VISKTQRDEFFKDRTLHQQIMSEVGKDTEAERFSSFLMLFFESYHGVPVMIGAPRGSVR
jgi:hypothetical protein